jgi:predicted nucleic acid-binding protein
VSHLLDTNAFVDHLRRGPKSRVTASLLAAAPGTVYLCSVVLAELIFGAVRSGAANEAANRALISGLMTQFPPPASGKKGHITNEQIAALWLDVHKRSDACPAMINGSRYC